MDPENKQHQEAADSIVLEEEIDPNYIPSEAEVVEYAKWLGMDLDKDQDLFWIAREGLMAPLPKNWKPCKQKDTEDIYYFDFTNGESTWDHPCDGYYKKQYEEHKKKKEKGLKESGDQKRSKAKQDVDQLLGKKKKGKDSKSSLESIPPISTGGGAGLLERKPLPGIIMQSRSIPMPIVKEFGSESSLLVGGGDSLFTAKSKTSSKLLAAVAGETADAKQTDRLGEFKLESKLDSTPLGSQTHNRKIEEGISLRRPSSAPIAGESKESGHKDFASYLNSDDNRSQGDLAPLFPRNKPLPSAASFGSNPLGHNTDSSDRDTDSFRLQQELRQVRDDLRMEGERSSRLEEDLRVLRSGTRDAEGAATEARRTAEAALDVAKSDMTSLEFSLRQANNYVADKNAAIDLVNTELVQRNQEIQSLTADRSGLQSQLAGLSREISRLTTELHTRTQEAMEFNRELGVAREAEQLAKRSAREQEELLQLERDKYVRLDDALSKTITSLRQRNSELELSLSIVGKTSSVESHMALDATALSLSNERVLVKTLREEIARRDESAAVAALDLEAGRAVENRLRTEVAILSTSLGERTGELATATNRLNELQAEQFQRTLTSDQLSNDNRIEAEKLSSLQLSFDVQLSQLRSQVAAVDSERSALLMRNEQLSSALEVTNSIISAANATSSNNSSSSSPMETSLSAVNASLIAQVSQLNVRICDLEDDLREARRKSELLTSELHSTETAAAEGAVLRDRLTDEKLETNEKLRLLTNERDATASNSSRLHIDYASLRSELQLITETLETERTQAIMKDKKIRSYQEELLQIQRRIAVPSEREVSSSSAATQTDAPVVEVVKERSFVASDVNSALDEFRGVVIAKEQTIAHMTSQLQELRSQLMESRSTNQSSLNNLVLQREEEAQDALLETRKKLDEGNRLVKMLTAKLQMTADQLVSSEAEGANYRSYWQEAEGKLLKLRSSQQQTAFESESTLSSTQEQVIELQAALSTARNGALQSRAECVESQRRLALLQAEKDVSRSGAEGLEEEVRNLRTALQAAREALAAQRVASQTCQPAVASVSAVVGDKQFESVVTNSIVELSIVVGKQQASVTRLEEQLQLMNVNQAPTVHQRPVSVKQNVRSMDTPDSGYISSSDHTPIESSRSNCGRGRRNVKFEEQHPGDDQSHDKQRGKQRVRIVDSRRKEDSSSEDLALLSLLRSPTEEDADGAASDRIEALGRRIESLWRKGAHQFDSHSLQTVVQLETTLLREAEGFLSTVKIGLRARSSSIASLKALWKSKGQGKAKCDGAGMSSSLINQQLVDLNNAIKATDELKNCIVERRESLEVLRDAVKRSVSHSGDSTRSKLQAAHKALSSGMHGLLVVMARITDNIQANQRDARRERFRAHDQSFDDSYVPYDRHQVLDYYQGTARRAVEAPESYGRSTQGGLRDSSSTRHSSTVSSSLEIPRQQSSRSLDQRRLFAQQHIAKIEKRQTDTWRECEDHVNFLAKIRKDLGSVSYSTGAKKTALSSNSNAETDRENSADYNCNMLLSGLDPGKKLYNL